MARRKERELCMDRSVRAHAMEQDFAAADRSPHDIYIECRGPAYFQTMRIHLFPGAISAGTTEPRRANHHSESVGGQAAASRSRCPRPVRDKKEGDKSFRYEVIGVVGDAKYEDLRSAAPPTAYVPITQGVLETRSFSAVVRTDGPAAPLVAAAHALAEQIEPGIPMPEMTSMSDTVLDSMSAERTMALLAVFFAICALVVTAIGLYGTLAYATARRTSEIGIRMALGARRAQVARMVFLQNAAVAVAGSCTGVVAALLVSRALASFLYGTSTRDPSGLCRIPPGAGTHRQCGFLVARHPRRRH